MKYLIFGCLFIPLVCLSCDPSHYGVTKIMNNSKEDLILHFKTNLKDSTINISSNSNLELDFGGIGAGNEVNCCFCIYKELSILPKDTSKKLLKDVAKEENWLMNNPNEKRFSSKEIQCTFSIDTKDIK